MNVLWKVDMEKLTSGNDPLEIHETSSLSYISE